MGSYGIGIGRTMAAIIEQNNDEHGIIWPLAVAPFHVVIVPVNMDVSEQVELAEKLYSRLLDMNIQVAIDDRNERPGVKFKDADLIGIPIRITVGRKAADGIVEFKLRASGENVEMSSDEAVKGVAELVENIRE